MICFGLHGFLQEVAAFAQGRAPWCLAFFPLLKMDLTQRNCEKKNSEKLVTHEILSLFYRWNEALHALKLAIVLDGKAKHSNLCFPKRTITNAITSSPFPRHPLCLLNYLWVDIYMYYLCMISCF